MNITNRIFKNASILTAIVLVLFFGLYILFSLNGAITSQQYYSYSIFICSFIVLPLFTLFSFFSILKLSKERAKNATTIEELMTFKEGFRLGFFTLLIAGIVSLAVIFIFFNTAGEWAQASLKDGILDTFMINMDPELAEQVEKTRNVPEIQKINLFSTKNFFGLFSMFLSFYMAISAMFSQFLKKRVY